VIVENFTASRTALATSLMRAVHIRSDPSPLIDDPWGDRLVPESVRREVLDANLRRSPAYENVIIRTRYTEDALKSAVERGVSQYVLLGAGFDSFFLRRPEFAANLEIFEIDHPATQGLKRQRIAELGISLPDSVHFIASDLSAESVDAALSRSSFRADKASFFSWLGVTMYLTSEANRATLQSIARCALAGSELALTYVDEKLLDSRSEKFQALQKRVTAIGEPFLSGFDPGAFGATLRACGLELIEDLAADTVAARYRRPAAHGSGRSGLSHLALARVMQPGGSHAKP
jgi:methyltransferase (TIGR00027 family)